MKPGNESGEDLNTRKVHGAIIREKAEPVEMMRAAPWWLKHCIYAPLCIWGIWYLTIASGGFRWDEYNEGYVRTFVPEDTAVCSACHQATGAGLPGAFPPLAGSDWVTGPEENIILTVLHGLNGEILVNGEKWNGMMPAQGDTLDDRKVAAVLSYIRSEWGNSAPPVAPASVTTLREKFKDHPSWTAADLDAALTE